MSQVYHGFMNLIIGCLMIIIPYIDFKILITTLIRKIYKYGLECMGNKWNPLRAIYVGFIMLLVPKSDLRR